ncbi:cytochrome b [Kordiimonas pumila]|uniref:Cytochrome b n=1 Tax=Kordiimonas pumila TaxID=2161677 RepID=A0ABV7D386_9PROT|nr:cytochrome b [Kordiimonas pumila]
MAQDTKAKFSHITISLHWIVGLTIITLLAVGLYMAENEVYSLYTLHKSVGVIVFAFVAVRVLWRIKNGWPVPASDYKRHEQILAKIVHWVLIIGTVLMPVSGMLMSGAGGHGFGIFGFEIMAPNPDPANPGEALPLNAFTAGIGHEMHEILGFVMMAAIALHIAGALKHHLIDKDETLKRMLGKTIDV